MHLLKIAHALSIIGTGTLSLLLVGAVGVACSGWLGRGRHETAWFDVVFRGYAVIVLVGWLAFTAGGSIASPLTLTLAAAFLILALRPAVSGRALRLGPLFYVLILLEFVILYFLYGGTDSDRLPFVMIGNHDIFNYANHAITLLAPEPGAANGFVGTDLPAAIRSDMFGAMVWLALPALLTSQPPIEVAMPAILIACALFGTLLYHLLTQMIRLPGLVALALCLFTLTNGVFLFVTFDYYLSQILNFCIFLGLVLSTLRLYQEDRLTIGNLILASSPYYFLMLMVYPVLLAVNGALQVSLVLALVVIGDPDSRRPSLKRLAGLALLSPALAVCLAALPVPTRVFGILKIVTDQAITRAAHLDHPLISLPMVVGWPGVNGVLHGTAGINGPVLAAVLAVCSLLTLLLVRANRSDRGLAPMAAMMILALLGWVLFAMVAAWYGPSYQQWKFASYYPLMLGAVPVAATLELLLRCRFAGVGLGCAAGLLALCGAAVAGNVLEASQRPFLYVGAGFRALQAIDQLPQVRTVLLDALPFGEVMLVRQYVTRKPLRPSSPSYYADQPITPDEVGPATPVLSRSPCFAGVPGTLALAGGFFLAPALPALEMGEPFRFGGPDCPWRVRAEGLGEGEGEGRATVGEHVRLTVRLSAAAPGALRLTLRAAPLQAPEPHPAQRVEVQVDGRPLDSRRFEQPGPTDWSLPVPAGIARGRRELTIDLFLADAAAPGLMLQDLTVETAEPPAGVNRPAVPSPQDPSLPP